jgi:hypothetical protein
MGASELRGDLRATDRIVEAPHAEILRFAQDDNAIRIDDNAIRSDDNFFLRSDGFPRYSAASLAGMK